MENRQADGVNSLYQILNPKTRVVETVWYRRVNRQIVERHRKSRSRRNLGCWHTVQGHPKPPAKVDFLIDDVGSTRLGRDKVDPGPQLTQG